MRLIASCLLLMLLVCSLSLIHGVLESPYARYRCQCTRVTQRMPRLRWIKGIKTYPPGNGCPRPEIIVSLKNDAVLCLDPEHSETFNVLKAMWKRRVLPGKSTPAQKT